ncbi:MAG: hypothetical protein ACR2FU_05885 [Streptosporangiaceae bacterium]
MTYLATSQGLLDQPGTVAFLVVFGMGVILFFVFRSMAKHLRRINLAARAEAEAANAAGRAADGDQADGDRANAAPADPSAGAAPADAEVTGSAGPDGGPGAQGRW